MSLWLLGLIMTARARHLIFPVLYAFSFMAVAGWPLHRYAFPILPFLFIGAAIAVLRLFKGLSPFLFPGPKRID